MRYTPSAVPFELDGLRRWIADELRRVANSLAEQEFIQLQERGVEPARPRNGMVVCADGVSWDPGSGAGVYEWRAAAWHKL